MNGAASRTEAAVCLVVFLAACVALDRALGVTWGMVARWQRDRRFARFQRQCDAEERDRIARAKALHPGFKGGAR